MMVLQRELSVLMLAVLTGVNGHPSSLSCNTGNNASSFQPGQQLMGSTIAKHTNGPVQIVMQSRSLGEVLPESEKNTFVPGEAIQLNISGLDQKLPNGTYFALQASTGGFFLLSADVKLTKACTTQVYLDTLTYPDNPPATSAVSWSLPSMGDGCATSPKQVVFTLVWANGAHISPYPTYANLTTLTLKISPTYTCVQTLDPSSKQFELAWKLDKTTLDVALVFTHRLKATPGPMWIALGLSSDGHMLSQDVAKYTHTAVILRNETDIDAYELHNKTYAGVVTGGPVQSAYGLKDTGSGAKPTATWMKFTQNIDLMQKSQSYIPIFTNKPNTVIFAAGPVDAHYHMYQGNASVMWAPVASTTMSTTTPKVTTTKKETTTATVNTTTAMSTTNTPGKCGCCDNWCSVTGTFFRPDQDQGVHRRDADSNNYTLSWRVTLHDFVEVSIDIPRKAWVAFGLAHTMIGAYAIICKPGEENSVAEFNLKAYDASQFTPLKRELEEVALAQELQTDGTIRTICSFKRNLTSTQEGSANFDPSGGNDYIMAAGADNKFKYHAFVQDNFRLDWFKSSSVPPKPVPNEPLTSMQSSIVLHGILMMVAWAYLLPSGLIVARFKFPNATTWFKTHIIAQCLGLACAFAGFGVIVYAFNQEQKPHFVVAHAKIGLVVMVIAGLQPLNALIRPGKSEGGTTFGRMVWELCHKGLGYVVVILAWVNMFLSMDLGALSVPALSNQKAVVEDLFYVGVALVLTSAAVLTIRNWFNKNKKLDAGSKHPRYEGF